LIGSCFKHRHALSGLVRGNEIASVKLYFIGGKNFCRGLG